MNFYVILGVPQEASTEDIKRAYRRLARRYHPGVNPGDRAAEEMFRADRRGLRNPRRSGSAPAVRHGGSAWAPAGGVGVVHVRRVRFFCRETRTAGVDVHRVVRRRPASDVGRRVRAGRSRRRSARGADGVVRGCRARRRAAGAGDAPGVVRRVRRCGADRDRRSAVPPVPGDGAHPLGARAHGVLEAVRGVRRRRPADARALRGVRGAGPRRPRRSRERAVPPGITDGGRLRVVEMGHAGRHGGRAGRLVRHGPRAAAPVVSARR